MGDVVRCAVLRCGIVEQETQAMTLRDPSEWRPASDPPYTTKRVEVLLVGGNGRRYVQGYYDGKRAQWFASFQARLQGRALNVEAWRPLR